MPLSSYYRMHNYMGEYANDSDCLTFIRANKWDSTGNGSGNPRPGIQYFNTTSNKIKIFNGTACEESASGDIVAGPASATDNAIVRFDDVTGKLIQNSSATIDDSGSINISSVQKYKINNVNLSASDVGAAATSSGITVGGTSGGAFSYGDAIVKSGTQWVRAVSAVQGPIGLSMSSPTASGQAINILLFGTMRNDSWTTMTIGHSAISPNTAGRPMTSRTWVAGTRYRFMGSVAATKTIFLNPSPAPTVF